jgi:hypothetical protein
VGTTPKPLTGVALLAEGRVHFGGATAMVTNELRPAAGSDCPDAALAEPDDGSTVMEGALFSLTVSSPAASLTSCFECLGFEELAEQNQGKVRIQ